ncbi:hypothetical protein [Lentilitoribacter sp. EG35]|uniref:hypothetical protein n=1 Tax=Lentilitoribacter sp. EG35 TaxID=3234192 RepID=UPI00346076B9
MSITFAPLFPIYVLATAFALTSLLVIYSAISSQRGWGLRATAFSLLLLSLTNPIWTDEEREPVKNIVSVLVDKSQSQLLQDRENQTDSTLSKLEDQLEKFDNIEVKVREFKNEKAGSPSSDLFSLLNDEISDIPSNRLAGTIVITDGQVHDIPQDIQTLGLKSPLHALVTGNENEFDIRIEIKQAPRFAIVDETQELTYQIYVDGKPISEVEREFEVEMKLNGEFVSTEFANADQSASAFIDIPRRGKNLVELSVKPIEGEVSTTNNIAFADIEGIRQNLKVLLVSGAPHSGERAWRNLLKSDTSIDLVHFTILRPPDRNDGTPIDELSLIAFPTRELFIEKIDEFDLIIFDRYQRLGVLSILYYDNIARYVEEGGALLVAAGPEFAGIQSIATTPLAPVLPAFPTGNVEQVGFYPRISETGQRHPVSRDLQGGNVEPPAWGRWFRSIEVSDVRGNNVLNGPNGNPLLLLNREGEGRVAMLLSDHGWLWSRGFEGGGPHVSLYRRIAHWLMKEPLLEEEALFAETNGNEIQITRQTMEENTPTVTIVSPSGKQEILEMVPSQTGRFELNREFAENGLYQISDGDFTALAHVGALNAPEFKASVSTTDLLLPTVEETKGIVARVMKNSAVVLPQIVPVRQLPNRTSERMYLRTSNETVLKGITQIPLLSGLLGLAAILFALSSTWYREGR